MELVCIICEPTQVHTTNVCSCELRHTDMAKGVMVRGGGGGGDEEIEG